MEFKRFLLICGVGLGVAGCGFDRKINPVIPTRVGAEVDALATDANRRLVLSSVVKHNKVPGRTDRVVCAEPSPDTVEALAASLKGSASANRASGNSSEASFERALATSAGALLRRSQGLQLFRDGVFALCQGSMNGVRTEKVIGDQFGALLREATKLIEQEMKTEAWKSPPTITIVQSPGLEKTEEKKN